MGQLAYRQRLRRQPERLPARPKRSVVEVLLLIQARPQGIALSRRTATMLMHAEVPFRLPGPRLLAVRGQLDISIDPSTIPSRWQNSTDSTETTHCVTETAHSLNWLNADQPDLVRPTRSGVGRSRVSGSVIGFQGASEIGRGRAGFVGLCLRKRTNRGEQTGGGITATSQPVRAVARCVGPTCSRNQRTSGAAASSSARMRAPA
jgi:hypothetical protein